MSEILLMLQVFLAEDPGIAYLLCGAPFRSDSAMIFSVCDWSLRWSSTRPYLDER